MSRPELSLFLYAAAGLIAYAGMAIYIRKEGNLTSGEKAAKPKGSAGRFSTLPFLLDPLILPIALLVWPVVLLGFLICWLDGKAVSDTQSKQ